MGKTMLIRRLPSIMAPLTVKEAVEVTRLYSLAGRLGSADSRLPENGGCALITRPPFRSPHHNASAEGMLGGGKTIRPGEISLAHYGVLFLDEAPEFRSNVLQSLREPLEDRLITIVRAEGPVRLPADFQLIMAANACPCGRLGIRRGEEASDEGDCFCSPEEIHRYWKKFGGALLDRIELRAAVSRNSMTESGGGESAENRETSKTIARRVRQAVEVQRRRFSGEASPRRTSAGSGPPPGTAPVCRRNAHLSPAQIDAFCPMSPAANRAFHRAMELLALSGRAYHSSLRVARTIADLEGRELIEEDHILEAVQHRRPGEDPFDILSAT
jgi:magnesium chelatase family protein